MPLPKPKKDEQKDEFMERCMSDSVMIDEYGDEDQRYAVCLSLWEKKENKDHQSQRADEIYTCECIECGHTLETEEHCKDIKCPECGGAMRRKERPGPGRIEDHPDMERRYFQTEELRVIDEDGKKKIEGYAAVFNKESENFGWFIEKITPGAFKNTLKTSDTRALFNHDPNIILGRQSAGTLKLKEDDNGLWEEIDPPDTQLVKDMVLSPIARKEITQQSFAFTVKREQWEEDHETGKVTRTILEIDRLFDVSPVTFPAYPDTSVALRSLEGWKKKNAPSGPEATLGEEDDITPADADELSQELSKLDTRLRKLEVSQL